MAKTFFRTETTAFGTGRPRDIKLLRVTMNRRKVCALDDVEII